MVVDAHRADSRCLVCRVPELRRLERFGCLSFRIWLAISDDHSNGTSSTVATSASGASS